MSIGGGLLGVLMSEVGTGAQLKTAFRSAEAFSSWLVVCPENRSTGQGYDEKEAFKVTPSAQAKRLQNLQKQAHVLGRQLVPV